MNPSVPHVGGSGYDVGMRVVGTGVVVAGVMGTGVMGTGTPWYRDTVTP